MSISLEKRAEKVGIILAKRNITTIPPVRVGLALDISGSTHDMYNSGVMQEAVDRLLAIAMKFDDNGELDMWTFENEFNRLETASAADYGGYVEREILKNDHIHKWGGTSYSPVMTDMLNFYFPASGTAKAPTSSGAKKSGIFGGLFGRNKSEPVAAPVVTATGTLLPACGLIVTDGQCDDRSRVDRLVQQSQQYNIYWQMVGVGPSHYFDFIEELGDKYPNVGYVNLSSLKMSDEELYDQLIAEEFCGWIKGQ